MKQKRHATRWALICLMAGSAFNAVSAQQHAGQYDIADIEYGAQLFAERCVLCHGERGDLLPQANLRTGTFRNASSDRGLMRVIRDGVDNTAMAATGYANAELTALVAYLRNITNFDPSASGITLGDPVRGQTLFAGRGACLDCHSVGTSGPAYAPALTRIGALRTAATLRRTLLDPTEALLPINRPVRAVTADGDVIEGRRLNEDTFTVQLITADAELVSLDKTALREFSIGDQSAMRAYGEIFSEQEIADLLAYLLSLKGFE
jgi:putative heme-binding domain-containing protein